MENVILVRYGEVFLKKGNRHKFLKILKRNLKESLVRVARLENAKVSMFHGRYLVTALEGEFSKGDTARAVEALGATFGVVSVSPAVRVEPDYEILEAAAVELATREIESRRVETFKVETSRSWKRFPMKSPDISRQVGAAVVKKFGLPARMQGPDLTVGIEIHEHGAYLFAASTRGPGGLPVGSGGRAVLLLSGGIDSPVAGWMMAKRGCSITAVHFHSYPYTTKRSLHKVNELARRLSIWLGPVKLFSMKITPLQEYLRDNVPTDKLVLFYRRSMVRLAARVARRQKALALVTGESLGQVASQTIENLAVIADATPLPILRPLVGMDKEETILSARKLGTFDISIQPYDDCCSLFLPPHPDTRGRLDLIRELEAGLDRLTELEDAAFADREEIVLLPV